MKTFKNNKILISTGGTGGHVFPAYSLAKNLIKKKFKVEIVTDQRGFKFLEKYKDLKQSGQLLSLFFLILSLC
jgi:UDP-N-acetylglucosamine:LPS N-acetylglucosamine transferase